MSDGAEIDCRSFLTNVNFASPGNFIEQLLCSSTMVNPNKVTDIFFDVLIVKSTEKRTTVQETLQL